MVFGSADVIGRAYDGTEHIRYRIGTIAAGKPQKYFQRRRKRYTHGDDNAAILERVAESANNPGKPRKRVIISVLLLSGNDS